MDASFEFLIPRDADLSPFDFDVPVYIWNGIKYYKEPREYDFGKNFKLVKENSLDLQYLDRYLPFHYNPADWQRIKIFGDGIHIYANIVHGFDSREQPGFTFKDLVYLMLANKSSWIVAFEANYDDGYGEIRRGNIDEIIPALNHSLKVSRVGFLLYH